MLQAILVSIVAFLAAIDEYTFGASMMGRPLFTAPIVGLILATAVGLAIRSLWRSHKSGASCSGDCSNCKHCQHK